MARKMLGKVTWVQQFSAVKYHLIGACRIGPKDLNCSLQLQRYCISAGKFMFLIMELFQAVYWIWLRVELAVNGIIFPLRAIPCTGIQKGADNISVFLAVAEQCGTSSRLSLQLSPKKASQSDGELEAGRGHSQDSWGQQPEQLTPIGQWDVSYHMVLCSAYKARRKERGGGSCATEVFFFQRSQLDILSLCFPGSGQTLPIEKQRVIFFASLSFSSMHRFYFSH